MAFTAAKRFLPLLDRVLVQKIKQQAQTKAGIFLPEAVKESANTAKVLSVGPGRVTSTGTKIPIGVKEGDIVVIPEYGGMSLKMDGEDLHVYRDEDIIGIVKE
eukprot:GHVU01232773.1.p2 GENE.GHVU01232773.1~~GHVU01232773.1.p2  ORF type:complete len:103 (-),score=22.27 GHVU01232773.1:780-1088(-)